MLTREKSSIIELLIALAWADGRVEEEETEVVEALLDAFGADKDETKDMLKWAQVKRTLDDVDISNLERSDLNLALQYSVLLTYIDGEQSAKEKELLDMFIKKLGISKEEAEPILSAANERAKGLLEELSK